MICNKVKRIISAMVLVVFMVTTLSINVTAAEPQIEGSEESNMSCSLDNPEKAENAEEEETNSQSDGSEQCEKSSALSSDLLDKLEGDAGCLEEKKIVSQSDGSEQCEDSSVLSSDLLDKSEGDTICLKCANPKKNKLFASILSRNIDSSNEDESGSMTVQYESLEYSFNKATRELTIFAKDMDSKTCICSDIPWEKYKREIKTITIKDGITRIYNSAFMGYESLTSVTIPGSVVDIGGNAFACCKKLTKVTYLGSTKPRMVSISVNKYDMRGGCFTWEHPFHSTSLETVIVPIYYKDDNFCGIKVKREESVTPDKILGDCGESLKYEFNTRTGELIISGSGRMEDYSYWNCNAFGELPWGLYKDRIKSVIIKDGVTKIGTGAFYNCKNLTSVTIPNSVTKIGNFAFSGCECLTSVMIPNNVNFIGESAFYSCTSLTSIIISSAVRFIGHHAFACCNSLKTVNYYGTTKPTVGRFKGRHSVFVKCPNLAKVNVTNDYKEKSFCGVKVKKDISKIIF